MVSIKTNLYQIVASLIRNIGGDIGIKLRLHFYRCAGMKLGKNVVIREGVMFYGPYNIEIGDYSAIGYGSVMSASKKIQLEKDVHFGPHCSIYDNSHILPTGNEVDVKEIKIGDRTWLGSSAIVLKGVKIGKNVTVGAGSVVTKNVPDNMVVVGVPAKPLKKNKLYRKQ